jgi:hypothetical protein
MLYFFDTLPVHPQPQLLEAFTSFIPRLAEANCIKGIERMSRLCFPSRTVRLRNFADYPLLSFEELPSLIVCSFDILRSTTFFYLVETFGRSTHPQHASRFLASTLADTLRYCPECIRERPWYILPWRFTMLSGCISHHCRLRDCCSACGLPVPLLGPSFRVGECPSCGVDLTVGDVEELNPAEHDIAQRRYRDLEVLLQPQKADQLSAADRRRLIGNQFALQRSEQGLHTKTVTDHLAITPDALRTLEWGESDKSSTRFSTYIGYAELLNIPLTTIIHSAYYNQSPLVNIVRDSLGRRRAVYFNGSSHSVILPTDLRPRRWTDEDLVAAIEKVANDLHAERKIVSGEAVLNELDLYRGMLKTYPLAKRLYKKIVLDHKQQRLAQYIQQINSTIANLRIAGTPVTENRIIKMSGWLRAQFINGQNYARLLVLRLVDQLLQEQNTLRRN